jgi:DivIVA domain-containing protein
VAGSHTRSGRATIVPMGQLFLFVVVALVVAAIVFGVTVMVSGGDSGLTPVEPDGRSLPLPSDRPLGEEDVFRTRFDTAFRGYRMAQVDQALQRAAYDIGYKGELIGVLEAEVAALREGRTADADVLRRAREAAVAPPPAEPVVVPDVISSDDKPGATPAPPAQTEPGQKAARSEPSQKAARSEPGQKAEKSPARAAGDEAPAESR